MADGMNRVMLLGNLGGEPELRYTASGTAVLTMRLATNESFVDKKKEVQERTDWHTVVIWGARAEALAKVLVKGMCVLVEGGLRTTSYEKDNVKRYRTEVHAREICIAGRRPPQHLSHHDDDLMLHASGIGRNDDEHVQAKAHQGKKSHGNGNGKHAPISIPVDFEPAADVPF